MKYRPRIIGGLVVLILGGFVLNIILPNLGVRQNQLCFKID